jgi:dipeptide/tripeptide permease
MLWWGLLFYPVSLVFGAILGLPIFFAMARFNLVNWWFILIGGFIVGGLVATLIQLGSSFQLRTILVFGLEGAGASLAFLVLLESGSHAQRRKRSRLGQDFCRQSISCSMSGVGECL